MFQEMHVDGAVTSNVLAVPEAVLLQKVAFTNNTKPKLYIIVNGKITPDFAVIGDGTLSIVARSFYSTVKANTRNTLIATYDFARRNGWQFRLAAIQPNYTMTSTTFNFDTAYMRALFDSRPLDGPHGTAMANVAEGARCKPWHRSLLKTKTAPPMR
jgi:hypothetical protein